MIRWRLYDNNPMREILEQMLHAAQQPAPGRGEPMPINVHQSESDLYLVAALPGVTPDAIDISYAEGLLTLRAHSEVADADYFHQEIRPIEYLRQVMLPVDCRFEDAEATVEHGMLQVRIPKRQARPPDKIRIQVNRGAGPTTIDAAKGVGYREVKAAAPPARPRPKAAGKGASGGSATARKGRPGGGFTPAR